MSFSNRVTSIVFLASLLAFSGAAKAGNPTGLWPPSTDQTLAAHVRAEAVQRKGGEWVIIGLSAEPIAAQPRQRPESQTGRLALPAGLLRQYARAFEALDVARLNRVWLLNPDERKMVTRLFETSEAIDLSIKHGVFHSDGERNWLEFDQYLSRQPRDERISASPAVFQRTLEAYDAHGGWAIPSASKVGGSLASATSSP